MPTRRSKGLRIRLLGEFAVSVDGGPVDESAWRLRKAKALIKLLALAPGRRLHREQAMDLLWPDLRPEAAANQLRKALHAARRALDSSDAAKDLIRFRDETLALSPDAWVDTEAFAAAVSEARREGDPDSYRRALDLYEGELLPEDRYEEWAEATREGLRGEFAAASMELVELLEARVELDEATALLRRVLEDDPSFEDAHRALMRVHALAGRRHDALQQYERVRDVLRTELDVEPDVATQELYEEIRAGQTRTPELRASLWEQVGDLRRLSGDAVGAAAAFGSALEEMEGETEDLAVARLHRKSAQALLMQHDAQAAAAVVGDGAPRRGAGSGRGEPPHRGGGRERRGRSGGARDAGHRLPLPGRLAGGARERDRAPRGGRRCRSRAGAGLRHPPLHRAVPPLRGRAVRGGRGLRPSNARPRNQGRRGTRPGLRVVPAGGVAAASGALGRSRGVPGAGR